LKTPQSYSNTERLYYQSIDAKSAMLNELTIVCSFNTKVEVEWLGGIYESSL